MTSVRFEWVTEKVRYKKIRKYRQNVSNKTEKEEESIGGTFEDK